MVLALCVIVSLATMSMPCAAGCPAGEILARTRGSGHRRLFYGVFVITRAVHAPIGLARASPTSGSAGAGARHRGGVRSGVALLFMACARSMRVVGHEPVGIRARGHPAYGRSCVHRFRASSLARFLPLHFWASGPAIDRRNGARIFPSLDRAPGPSSPSAASSCCCRRASWRAAHGSS